MLGGKLRSETFKTKATHSGLVTTSFVLEIALINLHPRAIPEYLFCTCKGPITFVDQTGHRTNQTPSKKMKPTQLAQENTSQPIAFGLGLTFDFMTKWREVSRQSDCHLSF